MLHSNAVILTITEQTVYGDQATYEAVYYANNDIMARIELVCHDETGTHSIKVSQENEGTSITTEAFSIISITDELDPYDLISIKEPSGRLTRYVADQIGDFMWTDVGEYEISVINRIGNKFSFKIEIDSTRYAALSFEYCGTGSGPVGTGPGGRPGSAAAEDEARASGHES